MNGHLFQIRVVFAAFEPVGCVLFVLGGDVTAHARHAAFTLFGTFQNDLNSDFFLCHPLIEFTGSDGRFERTVEAQFVDVFHTGRGHLEGDPPALAFRPEAFDLQIRIEAPLGLGVRVGDIVPRERRFTCDFANSHFVVVAI